MADAKVLAAINLHAVIRNLEDLCALDAEAQRIIANADTSVRFSIPGIDPLTLVFKEGACKAIRASADNPGIAKPGIALKFTGPEHFNLMVEGQKNPIPTRGFLKLNFLKNEFIALTERLEAYLRADEATLSADKPFARASTILTAYTAFFALSEIGNHDRIGQLSAGRIEDGNICIRIADGPAVTLRVRNGHMTTVKGEDPQAKAFMDFDCMDTADGILRGTLDSYACIGSGKLSIKGRVPMIDNLNKLLSLVAVYLA